MTSVVLIGNTVFSPGAASPVFAPGAVRVDSGTITHVGDPGDVPREGAEVIEDRGVVLVPGLANAHTHLYSTLARGMPFPGGPPASFREILERVWWKWDKILDLDAVEMNARAGLIEAARSGVTAVNDHHAGPRSIAGSLDRIAGAAEETGVRVALAYEVSDRDGPEVRDRGLEENERFAERLEKAPSPRLASTTGAHASFTLSDETLGRLAVLAEKTGRPVHIHMDEGPEDGEDARARGERSTTTRLAKRGVLRRGAMVAHAVHIDGEDRADLSRLGVFVSHNPLSNGGNAVGRADVPAMLRAGVDVGLGTDGMAGGLAGDAAAAGAAHRMAGGDRSIPFDLPARLVFGGSARLASRLFGETFGVLAPGAAGDVAAVRYGPPTPIDETNGAAHWQLGVLHAPVEHLVVAGRIVLREGRFPDLSEEEILGRARETARRLWKEMNRP
ncbi:MAG: amidohydrolase family protein [Candidatus Eisenbacteria bacterium]